MKHFLSIFMIAVLLTGCAAQRIETTQNQYLRAPAYTGTNHFIFWGLRQIKTRDAKEVCGDNNVLAVQTSTSFWDGVATVATVGIYAPKTYEIYCGQAGKKPIRFRGILFIEEVF